MLSPILHIHHQCPGLTQARVHQHSAVGAVELRHFDGVPTFVAPVQVASHPVHSQPIRVAEASAVQNLLGENRDVAAGQGDPYPALVPQG